MHELSLADSVVRIACAHAAGRPVAKVEVKVGHLRQVVPSALAFAFQLVAFVAPEAAAAALAALRSVPGGERAAEIGEVRTEPPGMVLVETAFGGKRVMDQLVGDPLPRIC